MQIGSISSEPRWKYNKIAHFHLHNSPYQFENFCQIPRTTKLQIKTTPKVSKGMVLALNKSWFKAEREPKKVYWEAQNCTARRRAPENCGCRFYMPHWTGFVVHCRKNSKESIVSSGHIGTSKTTGRLPTMLLCFILTKIQHLLGDSQQISVKKSNQKSASSFSNFSDRLDQSPKSHYIQKNVGPLLPLSFFTSVVSCPIRVLSNEQILDKNQHASRSIQKLQRLSPTEFESSHCITFLINHAHSA